MLENYDENLEADEVFEPSDGSGLEEFVKIACMNPSLQLKNFRDLMHFADGEVRRLRGMDVLMDVDASGDSAFRHEVLEHTCCLERRLVFGQWHLSFPTKVKMEKKPVDLISYIIVRCLAWGFSSSGVERTFARGGRCKSNKREVPEDLANDEFPDTPAGPGLREAKEAASNSISGRWLFDDVPKRTMAFCCYCSWSFHLPIRERCCLDNVQAVCYEDITGFLGTLSCVCCFSFVSKSYSSRR